MSDEKSIPFAQELYSDPENVESLKAEFRSLTTKDEIQSFIDRIFPNWLFESTDRYSFDYPHLQRNWEVICSQLGVKPQRIVGVSRIEFDDTDTHKFSLIRELCEGMTKKGYCVRRVGEFTSCLTCHRAIPVIEVWHLLREKGMPVPPKWSGKCRSCKRKK